MRDLRKCKACGGWREKYRSCDSCGEMDAEDYQAPANNAEPEGNSRSLRRLLRNKGRK